MFATTQTSSRAAAQALRPAIPRSNSSPTPNSPVLESTANNRGNNHVAPSPSSRGGGAGSSATASSTSSRLATSAQAPSSRSQSTPPLTTPADEHPPPTVVSDHIGTSGTALRSGAASGFASRTGSIFRGRTPLEWPLLRRRWGGRGGSDGRHGHDPGQGAAAEGGSGDRSGGISSRGAGGGVSDSGTHVRGFTQNISAPLLGSFPFSFWNMVQTPSAVQATATVRAPATGDTASNASVALGTAAAIPTGNGTAVVADRPIGTERPQTPRPPDCVGHTALPVDRNTRGWQAETSQPAKDVMVHSAQSGGGVGKASKGARRGGAEEATGMRRVDQETVGGRDEANIQEMTLRSSERAELGEADRISGPVSDEAVPVPGVSSKGGSRVGAAGGVRDLGDVKSRISSGVIPGADLGHDVAPTVVSPAVLPPVATGATAGRHDVGVNLVGDVNDGRSSVCVGGDRDDVVVVGDDDANRGPARCSSPRRYPVDEDDDGVVPAVIASGGALSCIILNDDDEETQKERADDGGLKYSRHHERPPRER